MEPSSDIQENNEVEPEEESTVSDEFETAASAEESEAGNMTCTLASLRRRFLDTYHHRPERLWVTVNGIPVASLDVNKDNSLTVTTKVAERLSFVEVFSEQQIRLAMLNINTGPDNPIETEARVSLSNERELDISFEERDSELSIRLGYRDPEIEGWERLASLGAY